MKGSDARVAGKTSDIDWREIHLRLDKVRTMIERNAAPDADTRKHLLRARAAALASEPATAQAEQEALEIVEFHLAHERYGIETRFVREVCSLNELTPLPGTPAFVLGIINVRGQIVSVVDLKKFFDLPEKGLTDLNKVIIVGDGGAEFGVLADAVPLVQYIPLAEIQPPLPTLTGVRHDYLKGVTNRRLVILDIARILSDPRVMVCEEAQT